MPATSELSQHVHEIGNLHLTALFLIFFASELFSESYRHKLRLIGKTLQPIGYIFLAVLIYYYYVSYGVEYWTLTIVSALAGGGSATLALFLFRRMLKKRMWLHRFWIGKSAPVSPPIHYLTPRKISREGTDIIFLSPNFEMGLPFFKKFLNKHFTKIQFVKLESSFLQQTDLFSYDFAILGEKNEQIDSLCLKAYIVKSQDVDFKSVACFKQTLNEWVYLTFFAPPPLKERYQIEPSHLQSWKSSCSHYQASFKVLRQDGKVHTHYTCIALSRDEVLILITESCKTDEPDNKIAEEFMHALLRKVEVRGADPHHFNYQLELDSESVPTAEILLQPFPKDYDFREFLRTHAADPAAWLVFEKTYLFEDWFARQYIDHARVYSKNRRQHIKNQIEKAEFFYAVR